MPTVYSIREFFIVLLKIAGNSNRVDDVQNRMTKATGWSEMTVRKYLQDLEDQEYIMWLRSRGRHGQNDAIIKKREPLPEGPSNDAAVAGQEIKRNGAPSLPAMPSVTKEDIERIITSRICGVEQMLTTKIGGLEGMIKAQFEALQVKQNQPAAQAAPQTVPEKTRPDIAVLVDYDNVVATAADELFKLSFRMLMDYIRSLGNVVFAQVFLPSRSYNEQTVAKLYEAGFTVTACPMACKDKDAVDETMRAIARKYLTNTAIDVVVIVSRDADFLNLAIDAENMHKQVRFVDVVKKRELFEGEDPEVVLVHSRETQEFIDTIRRVENDNLDGLQNGAKMRIQYLADIITELMALDVGRTWTFNAMRNELTAKLEKRWAKIFTLDHITRALSAMVDRGMLVKNQGVRITFYTLNFEHTVVKKIVDELSRR